MRQTLLTLCLLLTACATRMPKTATIVVEKLVPVPAKLTVPCDEVPKKSESYGEAIRLANSRLASLHECNARMTEIRNLGRSP